MNAESRIEMRSSGRGRIFWWMFLLGALPAFAAPDAPQTAYGQDGARSGKTIVEAVCASCHGTGEQGAPKIGDREVWAKRASQGLTGLTKHALEGIRSMPPHGGNTSLSDLEIQRAITYMVNQSGGQWVEPVSAKDLAADRSGEQVVKAQCAKCHDAGEGGAPKIGDRTAWTPRMKDGIDLLVRSAIRGHGGMPPRGGDAQLTDTELREAVLYMFNPAGADTGVARSPTAVPSPASSTEKSVGGFRILLGFTRAASVLALPTDSVERTMHGGVPNGAGYYHLNVSLFDRMSNAPIPDARIEARIEQPGLWGESKTLQPMAPGPASYGTYVRASRQTPYQVILRIRTAGSPSPVEARFEHTF